MAEKVLKVPCPTCRQPSLYGPANPWRPFCSERCRGVDLGAWVPAEAPPDGDSTPPDPPQRH